MVKVIVQSDPTLNVVNYPAGNGAYTTAVKVAALLGVADFISIGATGATSPTLEEVGDLIRRAEDYIDEFTNESWRENLAENEFHDFDFFDQYTYFYEDYAGKIRTEHENVRKIIRIAFWDGDSYRDVASAVSTVTISSHADITSITLGAGSLSWTLTAGTDSNAGKFNKSFGKRTTALELAYLINEQPPTLTASFTGASTNKALQDSGTAYNISDFFYANVEEDESITIVSLLPGSDGSSCTIATSGSGLSATSFTNKELYDRNETWWDMRDAGDIFFRADYPLHRKHSVKITYTYGNHRVPAVIEEAATKLVACELLASDDSYVLVGDDSTGINIQAKYDAYKKDVDAILRMKKRINYYLDND